MNPTLPFFTLLLLISFGSVNAVLFTPALPNITHFFAITPDAAQYTITWFLIGYAFGQLLYGPIANRYGRKFAIYVGIFIQIISCLLCITSGIVDFFWLLVFARFLLALGSGVGLKITFTLVNECYAPQIASQKTAYLMLGFGLMPGLSVALGGFLNTYWDWFSCFYASIIYGFILLFLASRLPETKKNLDLDALKFNHLIDAYYQQFRNRPLVLGGILLGFSSSFIYIFAAWAPFLAINLIGMTSFEYGLANCIPPVGLVAGSLASARLAKHFSLSAITRAGIFISLLGSLQMFISFYSKLGILSSLFVPMIVIYFGLCMILASTSAVSLGSTTDKAHGAAVMSFLNIGIATIMTFISGLFTIKPLFLPGFYLILCGLMFTTSSLVINKITHD